MIENKFQSTLHDSTDEMLAAIAYSWMTADGANLPDDVDALLAHDADPTSWAAECVECWGLAVATEDGPAHMALNDYSADDLAAAIGRFITKRPDVPATDRIKAIAEGCASNGVDIIALAQEWTNNPAADVDLDDGTIWNGVSWVQDDESLRRFCDFMELVGQQARI